MAEVRLSKRKNGKFYLYFSRTKKISLKTTDEELAKKAFHLIKGELYLAEIYGEIVERCEVMKEAIEKHYGAVANIIGRSKKITIDRPYFSEASLEEYIYQNLSELGIKPIGRQVRLFNGNSFLGIVDILGEKNNKKVIIEVKMGTLSIDHLGQCLRYLKAKDINELYLIGEAVNGSVHIFADYGIKVFTLSKRKITTRGIFLEHKVGRRRAVSVKIGQRVDNDD